MPVDKARKCFETDCLAARPDSKQTFWSYDDVKAQGKNIEQRHRNMSPGGGMQLLSGNSFTRNPRLVIPDSRVMGRKVIAVEVDQARVSQTNKIVPLNADLSSRSFAAHHDNVAFNDRFFSRRGNDSGYWAEEFVVGDLKPLSRYITRIIILVKPDEMTTHTMKQLRAAGTFRYAEQHGIPVVWRDGNPVEHLNEDVYREEPMGSFTHDGAEYYLNPILERAVALPVEQFRVSDLDWILDQDADPKRVAHADLSAPILVTSWRGRLVVLDGYHRLLKAKREGRAELPGKLIPEEWLLAARIAR